MSVPPPEKKLDKHGLPKQKKVNYRIKLTDELMKRAYKLVQSGAPVKTVVVSLGVNESTWYAWLNRAITYDQTGRPLLRKYRVFANLIEKAAAEAELAVFQHVRAAVERPKAGDLELPSERKDRIDNAKWLLTHRFRDNWSPRERVEVTGADGGPVQTQKVKSVILLPRPKFDGGDTDDGGV